MNTKLAAIAASTSKDFLSYRGYKVHANLWTLVVTLPFS